MRKLFSSAEARSREEFDTYLDIVRSRFVPTDIKRYGDRAFKAEIEAADIGGMLLTRSTFSAHRVEATPLTIRRHSKQDTLAVIIRLAGRARSSQYDRTMVQQAGDLTVFDRNKPLVYKYPDATSSLLIELPRERLESALGAAPLYAGLTVGGDLPGASLVRTFFDDLIRVHKQMSPDMAERMTRIGADLIVASIAERLAQETPRPLQGTVTVQRAKAFVEANLGDPTFDPSQLAAALGVSLRHLQQLFRDRGHNVADWLWHRRLEVAAQRLADRGHAHLPIGELAYGCGFISQAHFSRRFKERFDLTPSEYRRMALTSAS